MATSLSERIFGPRKRTIRVAVVGGAGCGKTVFLAALANHLHFHSNNRDKFYLNNWMVESNGLEFQRSLPRGVQPFDFNGTRGSLTSGHWPAKTVVPSMLRMELYLTRPDERSQLITFELMDIPGERVGDFGMMNRDYRAWCKWMQDTCGSAQTLTGECYNKYLSAVRDIGHADKDGLFNAYKNFISHEYATGSSLLSPSTLLLDLNGTQFSGRTESEYCEAISNASVGLQGFEFVPLPEECLEAGSPWSPLVREFERSYKIYKAKIVKPIEGWLSNATKLFYLVDMLKMLKFGPEAWGRELGLAQDIIMTLCPRRPNGVLRRLGSFVADLLWHTSINTAYIVSTKSDLVTAANRNNLKTLTQNFMGSAVSFLDPAVSRGVCTCAAVKSTEDRVASDGRSALRGKLNLDDAAESNWIPSDVPTVFPAEWEPAQYSFPACFPVFPAVRNSAPKQLGLNTLAQIMLDLE